MSLDLIRGLYDYHRWANGRLFDAALALGEDLAARDVGKQFSYTTIREMFGHLYGADRIWLSRWTGGSMTADPRGQFATLSSIRAPWDDLLAGVIQYTNAEGKQFRAPLGPLLQHVANHATHHRSEIATMLTMVSSSSPDTGLATYLLVTTNQLR